MWLGSIGEEGKRVSGIFETEESDHDDKRWVLLFFCFFEGALTKRSNSGGTWRDLVVFSPACRFTLEFIDGG